MPFQRLVSVANRLASNGNKVSCQAGVNTDFVNEVHTYDFMKRSVLLRHLSETDVIITQGGFGSLYDAVSSGTPVLAIPRMVKFGETDHDQQELCEYFASTGKLRLITDESTLDSELLQWAAQASQAFEAGPTNNAARLGVLISSYIKSVSLS